MIFSCKYLKLNNTVNKFLLARDRFMLEMHLKQQGFTYSARELFSQTNKNAKIQRSNELDKVCF